MGSPESRLVRQRGKIFRVDTQGLDGGDYNDLTLVARRDERWQEQVLMALIKHKPARSWTHRHIRPVIAALLELTF